MNILMLVIHLSTGGAETQVLSLSKELKSRGYTVRIVSMMNPSSFVDYCDSIGLPVYSLGFKRGRVSLVGFIRFIFLLYKFRPDVVHAHTFNANFLARISKLFFPFTRLICTPHSSYEGGNIRTLIYRYTDFLSNINTNVSKDSVEAYIQKGASPRNKMLLVYNGIDFSIFNKTEKQSVETFKWISVGRLSKVKNFFGLLTAFREVSKVNECTLTIVGEGEERENLKELINNLELNDCVFLVGKKTQDEITSYLNNSDAFVLNSLWEGLPMVLLEAAAVGLPAVVTKVGGNLEVYKDGISCISVESDNVENLTSAMIRLMEMPVTARQKMGKIAMEEVNDRFEIGKIVDIWEGIYAPNSIIGKSKLANGSE